MGGHPFQLCATDEETGTLKVEGNWFKVTGLVDGPFGAPHQVSDLLPGVCYMHCTGSQSVLLPDAQGQAPLRSAKEQEREWVAGKGVWRRMGRWRCSSYNGLFKKNINEAGK